MPLSSVSYLALLFSLPARNATERMRAWRALKSMGGAVLRDGVYLLPAGNGRKLPLIEVARGIQEAGGQAEVVGIVTGSEAQNLTFRALFDRQADYLALRDEIARIDPDTLEIVTLKRTVRLSRRRFNDIARIDFFPNDQHAELLNALTTLEARCAQRLDPSEPTAAHVPIPRLDPAAYQRRIWVTRARPWADRLASAWLIRRFIDPEARMVWFTSGQELPHDALGFDFDGAPFTHVGDRVTFEVLLAAFGLEGDPALMAIGRMIHALDLGGTTPEAAGFESLLKGMRQRTQDDDAFLEACRIVLDDFYLSFTQDKDLPHA
ncbi:MAG: chromate resistance protein [Magnetococcales bacterium]|nr:chromate resistance protein [Magnetococcales bacterium]